MIKASASILQRLLFNNLGGANIGFQDLGVPQIYFYHTGRQSKHFQQIDV
ncbi:MAG: hypothetical protein ACI8O8_001717 [Oleiphilaceae bacterium]|jgi:hypothetical protein